MVADCQLTTKTERSNPSEGELDTLRLLIKYQQQQLEVLSQTLSRQENELRKVKTKLAEEHVGSFKTSGTNYVRWGKSSCPGDSSLIYEGEVVINRYVFVEVYIFQI